MDFGFKYLRQIAIAGLLSAVPCLGLTENQDRTVAFVKIVNYEQSVEYRIHSTNGVAEATRLSGQPANSGDPLADVTAAVMESRKTRRQAVSTIRGSAEDSFKWANLSPDGVFALVGFQDPFVSAMTSSTVYRVAGLEPIKRINSEGRILDSLWSQDSKTVVILEVTERMKKTPWGLLAAVSGHAIEIQTLYVRIVNVESGAGSRLKVADGVVNGESELSLQQ